MNYLASLFSLPTYIPAVLMALMSEKPFVWASLPAYHKYARKDPVNVTLNGVAWFVVVTSLWD